VIILISDIYTLQKFVWPISSVKPKCKFICVELSTTPCNGVTGDSGARWIGGWMEHTVNLNRNLCVSGIEPHYLGASSPYSISCTVKNIPATYKEDSNNNNNNNNNNNLQLTYRSLNAIVAQTKNCLFRVNTTIGLKNLTTTSDNNGI